ncbi:MAG: O-antigen ligase family protein [Verrucomicrobiota bacterium]|jgi:hypothetical protein
MNGKLLWPGKVFEIIVVAFFVLLCLFGDSRLIETNSAISSILSEVKGLLCDSDIQWILFLLLLIYFLIFLRLQCRIGRSGFLRMNNRNLWLAGLLFLGAIAYALNYPAAAKSTQALMLLAGVTLGLGASAWADFKIRNRKSETAKAAEFRSSGNFNVLVVLLLIIFLTPASLWQPDWSSPFDYRGHLRWTGPWENPNIYGLLMGIGVVLATGQFVQSLDCGFDGRGQKPREWAIMVLYLVAIGLTGWGLLNSYSRSAWLGTLCGLVYLVTRAEGRRRRAAGGDSVAYEGSQKLEISNSMGISWFKKNRPVVCVVLLSLVVLAFWQLTHLEHVAVANRIVSVGNVNDFSWRNRVAAWEGSLQIIGDHPWLGAGWNQAESLYKYYYLAPKSEGIGAIQLNDYLMLGAILGIPAMVCFVAYAWLSLTWKPEDRTPKAKIEKSGIASKRNVNLKSGSGLQPSLCPVAESRTLDWTKTVCRAGAIVLLVGFLFDDGLFSLMPIAIPCWTLLELGAARPTAPGTEGPSGSSYEENLCTQ